jgi:hypothetical protein
LQAAVRGRSPVEAGVSPAVTWDLEFQGQVAQLTVYMGKKLDKWAFFLTAQGAGMSAC